MISLTYIGSINLCVLCVSVVPSTPSLGGMYLRIHFTHQTWESQIQSLILSFSFFRKAKKTQESQ
nr:hypothetical protein [Microcystis aeruginosa]